MQIIQHNPVFFHLTFAPHSPALTIKQGQTVRVTVPDCDGIGPDGKQLDQNFFKKFKQDMPVGNPVAGPYYIENAEVGDCIAVHIEKVKIEQNFGRTGISSKQIHIPAELLLATNENNRSIPQKIFKWQLDHTNNMASFNLQGNPIRQIKVPIRAFPGCIAVSPPKGFAPTTLTVGNYGGNLDIPSLQVGSCLYLPVFIEGAYLFIGDLHAAQGDGEIIGGGIEVGGTVEFRVDVIKKTVICTPAFEDDEYLGTIGTADALQPAIQAACAQMIRWLAERYNFDRWDAMNIVSQTSIVRPGNFQSAICQIPKSIFCG